jgi:hypothetical protein
MKNNYSSLSTIHLKIILSDDTPQYVIDFFNTGKQHPELPSVLYSYGFTFNNKPNFATNRFMMFEKVNKSYHLQIEYQFEFDNENEVLKGYWFVGGLAQYAKDNLMAGYIKHSAVSTQLFGFKNKQCYWLNGADINFEEIN